MKKLNYILLTAGLASLMMQACHNNTKSTVTDSTVTTDVTTTDSSKMIAPVDTGDANFAAKAAAGGMTEIALSKVAEQQATTAKIKDFASMMVTDHSAAGDKLAAIAKAKNIALPSGPDTVQQNMINDISKKTGKAFDKAYVNQMVKDHEAALRMFKKCQKMVKDTALRSFFVNTTPMIQKHLTAIKAIKSSM